MLPLIGPLEQSAYYDREARIVFFKVLPGKRPDFTEERGWGLIHYLDRDRKEVCGIEIWNPEQMFPPGLLDALPNPTWTRWDRLTWQINRRWGWVAWNLWRKRRWHSPEAREELDRGDPPRPGTGR